MSVFETGLYELASLFLLPVHIVILLAMGYAVWAFGNFATEAVQRRRHTYRSPLDAYRQRTGCTSDDLELVIMKRLEGLRLVARAAPMLGLVATMLPMGPALLGLTRNDAAAVGENLVVAFSAVVLALVSASLAFVILTVRRRWLLQDLRAIERRLEAP